MDTVLALQGKDFVLVAADTAVARSIMRLQDKVDKILTLDSHKLLGIAGPVADRTNFSDFIQRNVQLYQLKAGVPLSTQATASFIRTQLAEALRKGPYQANLVVAGFDKGKGPSLYFMDYLASMHPVKKAAHGYGAYFTYGLLDRHFKEGMELVECVDLIKKCIHELQTRFLIAQPSFVLKVVDAEGTRTIDLNDFA